MVIDIWANEAALRMAWKRVRRNKGGEGGDGQKLDQFGNRLDERLISLAKVLNTGTYTPGPLKRFSIGKKDGGTRSLAIPCVRDRVAQAACASALDKIFDPLMSDASFAYRKGRSVEHAAGLVLTYRLRGYRWAVDGDIASYFDNIGHGQLLAQVREKVRCPRTLAIIDLWLRSFSKEGIGVAQGSPLSPVLANIYLTGVDRLIDRKDARLVRYADDFLILCRRRADAERALAKMSHALADLGLALNADKTRIVNLAKGVEFLGVMFRGTGIWTGRARVTKGSPGLANASGK